MDPSSPTPTPPGPLPWSVESSREAARRETEILARLKNDLKNNRLAIVVGAGVTLSATADASGNPLSRITWTGLIRNGLDYLVNEGYVGASSRRIKRAYEALEDPDTDSLFDAANILSSQLTQHGQFPTWLETVFGNLAGEIRYPAVLEVLKLLHGRGATLLTTNYDDLLERHCDLYRIGRSKRDDIIKFRRGDLDGVFHVHGSYHDPHEVVLDTTDYYEVRHSDEVQNVLKTLLECKTMLFVGCGSGLEDPNFDALLKWASERQKDLPHRHCLLVRDGDNLKYKPLVRLKYGPGYQDLAPYLNRLLDEDLGSLDVAAGIPLRSPDITAGTPLRSPDITASVPLPTQNTHLNSFTTRTYQDYTVGWICALPTEMAAAVGMLDERHSYLSTRPHDGNTYTLGRIGDHNVVIACLPAGVTGTTSAAHVGRHMLHTFESIRFGLMVGIGSGVPSAANDIRLGDVVVSNPSGSSGGVSQYDFGKTIIDGQFARTGSLSRPPDVLLGAVANLQAKHMMESHELSKNISVMIEKYPAMRNEFTYQGAQHDHLFEADYEHPGNDATCENCDMSRLIHRPARSSDDPVVLYGLIASANQGMRDGRIRDRVARDLDVLCFEIEAAGLMDNFPCLVIRGICDYADSHKNKRWQRCAAAAAAAYAKELLCIIPGSQVFHTRPAAEMTTTELPFERDRNLISSKDITPEEVSEDFGVGSEMSRHYVSDEDITSEEASEDFGVGSEMSGHCVSEDSLSEMPVTGFRQSGDRGRLFLKVVRVKDLDLPLPKGQKSYFTLTLDNGVHMVTTFRLELGKTAPVGQEFELVVLNDLEFQLTLKMKLEKQKPKAEHPPWLPAPPPKDLPRKDLNAQKGSTFSRVFTSSKERKKLKSINFKQALEAPQSEEQNAQPEQTTAWDTLSGLLDRDGNFARAYVRLSDHEKRAYGRSYTVDVPCFNEWATEESTPSSVKSKKSAINGGVQRRPPYKICMLELRLLYVPRPKNAMDEDMPRSMNDCIRQMEKAESLATKNWEGYLSQQGGDCPYWRRRFYKLTGFELRAYHEMTHQPRTHIHLVNATALINDEPVLTQDKMSTKGGDHRKSAFAEGEGDLLVKDGFRIRFANGEVIDFYATSAAEKEGWIKVLHDVVGKGTKGSHGKDWTEMVLRREKANAAKASRRAAGSKGKET